MGAFALTLLLAAADPERTSAGRKILVLAQSNYEVRFDADTRLSERVLFPVTPSQRNGIEDARFVRFVDDDGAATYCATYTAYDGKLILPQFVETRDFLHFRFFTLNGAAARNKGMALFPRRIGGRYVMLGRQDNENIWILESDDLYRWEDGRPIMGPEYFWEFVQLGNCGSPIEIDEGWLVFTHGVAMVRAYCVGACLLDKRDPSIVLARTEKPLLIPSLSERGGYVPNVVYSCGALVRGREVLLPFAVGDRTTAFATGTVESLEEGSVDAVSLVLLFLFYLAQYFVIFFFNSALVGAAMIRLDGGDPTVRDGLRIASSRIGQILGYAAIAATVGLILRLIEERAVLRLLALHKHLDLLVGREQHEVGQPVLVRVMHRERRRVAFE